MSAFAIFGTVVTALCAIMAARYAMARLYPEAAAFAGLFLIAWGATAGVAAMVFVGAVIVILSYVGATRGGGT